MSVWLALSTFGNVPKKLMPFFFAFVVSSGGLKTLKETLLPATSFFFLSSKSAKMVVSMKSNPIKGLGSAKHGFRSTQPKSIYDRLRFNTSSLHTGYAVTSGICTHMNQYDKITTVKRMQRPGFAIAR